MLNHESIDAMCRRLPGVTVSSPFGPDNAVYKVGPKMFALLSLDMPRLNLKCDPEAAVLLRERYAAVEPGYHMSKRHWNSVYWERDLPAAEVEAWITDSYTLVFATLKKADREAVTAGAL